MKEDQDGQVLSNYNSLELVLQTSSMGFSGIWDSLSIPSFKQYQSEEHKTRKKLLSL